MITSVITIPANLAATSITISPCWALGSLLAVGAEGSACFSCALEPGRCRESGDSSPLGGSECANRHRPGVMRP